MSGRLEIYAERFPDLGNRVTISTGGGQTPHWSSAGDELFYRRLDGAMMVVPLDATDTAQRLAPGTPELLFEPPVPMIYETTSLLRLVSGRGGFDG